MATMRERSTKPMYDIWSWFYNWTFGALVRSRQRRAVQQLPFKPGDRILDLGVGTGLTLKHYPTDVTVIGMDLSHGMISKAKVMCQQRGYDHIKLVRGDGMYPPFAENSFDHIIMCHTVTVVSDPARLLNWAAKIVKPGGRIVLANHFRSTNPIMGFFEKFTNQMGSLASDEEDETVAQPRHIAMGMVTDACLELSSAHLQHLGQ